MLLPKAAAMPYSIYIESKPTNLSTMNEAIRIQHAEIINAVAEGRMDFDTFQTEVLEMTVLLLVDEGVLTQDDLVNDETTPEADEIFGQTYATLIQSMQEKALARREVLAAA